jgi:hypothetical protein
MGWKASLVIVQHPETTVPEEALLQALGFRDVAFSGNTVLELCLYPRDDSVNIGSYHGPLVLAEDYQLTNALDLLKTPGRLVDHERILCTRYPDSEILSVACHSVVNYHLYALAKSGERIRYKRVVHGQPIREFGERLPEEEQLYRNSIVKGGRRLFKSDWKNDGVYNMTEDQLMENFIGCVAKRLLGVSLANQESRELTSDTVFRKYRVRPRPVPEPLPPPPKAEKRSLWGSLFG